MTKKHRGGFMQIDYGWTNFRIRQTRFYNWFDTPLEYYGCQLLGCIQCRFLLSEKNLYKLVESLPYNWSNKLKINVRF